MSDNLIERYITKHGQVKVSNPIFGPKFLSILLAVHKFLGIICHSLLCYPHLHKLTIVSYIYIYTEQNYKRNTFVFAPIFHELNSKI